jgi:putative component of toxin-antitoxin plasmid stabilization module
MGYDVIEVRQTEAFGRWLAGLRDSSARMRINARIGVCRLAIRVT